MKAGDCDRKSIGRAHGIGAAVHAELLEHLRVLFHMLPNRPSAGGHGYLAVSGCPRVPSRAAANGIAIGGVVVRRVPKANKRGAAYWPD